MDTPAGTVTALHGWGQRAADFGVHWQTALDAGLLVSVPESSQAESPEFFVWTDKAAAEQDIAAAFAALRAAHPVDERRLIAAGFSQGGGLAVSIALTGRPLPAAAFVAFGAALDDVDAGALTAAASAAERGVRGALVVGAEDEALPGARELHARLRSAGLACSLTVVSALGHAMPADDLLIGASLRSVLQS